MKRRSIFIITFIFLFAATSFAQENKCALKLSQLKAAPELQGFRLGMTISDVKTIVPTLPTGKADDLGMMKTSFSPRFAQIDKTKFENVRTVSFEFLDDKLMDLWIGYTSDFKWTTMDDFFPQMNLALGLPANGWQTKGTEKRLECEEFQVSVTALYAGPTIRFVEKSSKKLWEQRRAIKAEKEDANNK